jgi:hypothetical protein
MKILMIELNMKGTNSSSDAMDLEDRDHVIDISNYINKMYNLIVCKDCGIGVSFERVLSHLWKNHAIKVTMECDDTFELGK